jgi:Heterokaryon incompatibility protein (HET)
VVGLSLSGVDLLCINQADLQERSQQVSLMKYIYASAMKVIVWLGEDELTTGGRAASVAGRAIALLRAWASKSALELTNTVQISADFLVDTNEARANVACIQSLLERPWWSRAWVFQELCLANEADIVCGEFSLPWTAFDNACFAIGRSVHMDDLFDVAYASSMRVYYSLFRPTKSNRAETSRRLFLSQLLYETNSRSATDPRDKIYALLGLVW